MLSFTTNSPLTSISAFAVIKSENVSLLSIATLFNTISLSDMMSLVDWLFKKFALLILAIFVLPITSIMSPSSTILFVISTLYNSTIDFAFMISPVAEAICISSIILS